MIFEATKIPGVIVISPDIHLDDRGYFARTFCAEEFRRHGIELETVHCNVSYNASKGTLRGLHYQASPASEPKLVRCARGRIFDVAVDLRLNSVAYCQWMGIELTAENLKALFIPKGCAHGFITLEENTEVLYQMGAPYVPELTCGRRWNDPAFGIQWPIAPVVISERDASYPDHQSTEPDA